MKFTPRVSRETEERIEMALDEHDHAKIERGHPWRAMVTDLDTGRRYLVEGAACPLLGCFCDAVIVREVLH